MILCHYIFRGFKFFYKKQLLNYAVKFVRTFSLAREIVVKDKEARSSCVGSDNTGTLRYWNAGPP